MTAIPSKDFMKFSVWILVGDSLVSSERSDFGRVCSLGDFFSGTVGGLESKKQNKYVTFWVMMTTNAHVNEH
jgi:hypothetical protein